jgi:hypothetical protein
LVIPRGCRKLLGCQAYLDGIPEVVLSLSLSLAETYECIAAKKKLDKVGLKINRLDGGGCSRPRNIDEGSRARQAIKQVHHPRLIVEIHADQMVGNPIPIAKKGCARIR